MKYLILILLTPTILSAQTKDDWIRFYLRDCHNLESNQVCKLRLERSISLMNNYKPMVFYHLKKNDLPTWLAILPVIESWYNKRAVSYINNKPYALGMWQIAWSNVQKYLILSGFEKLSKEEILKSEIWVDPELSTKIACWILKGLYQKYGDWKLVIYAYNAGIKVDNHISNGDDLPEQTANFYQQFLALNEIISNQEKYNIKADISTEYYYFLIKSAISF